MKHLSSSKKLFLSEVAEAAKTLHHANRKLPIGDFIHTIRTQLKMTQVALAKRVKVPQSTISRIEQHRLDPTLSLLTKIFDALSCELVIAPMLREPIESICHKQARLVAERHVKYLRGTMHLEKQGPDKKLLEELINRETEILLHSPGTKLWDDE
ncbi:helix-turn-helix domain-containing protein [Candidatus Dependentiae bacterium]|nr:helix-turn-helix domain-containing protein [Candidatus Dependentiae bacterium]